MSAHLLHANSSVPNSPVICKNSQTVLRVPQFYFRQPRLNSVKQMQGKKLSVMCSEKEVETVRTCKNCKTQYNPLLNHPRACRYHTAHFGGETRRKFESVYTGGTMDTPESGKVFQYWHCCGAEDPFNPGCTAAPHASYDD